MAALIAAGAFVATTLIVHQAIKAGLAFIFTAMLLGRREL